LTKAWGSEWVQVPGLGRIWRTIFKLSDQEMVIHAIETRT